MKLRNLYIENYKIFKKFDISFVDENDEPLPIVILAGVNGSGKTTLLEMIVDYQDFTKGHIFANSNIKYEYDTEEERLEKKKYFFLPEKVVYFPSGVDDTKKVVYEFVQTFYFFLKEKDYRSSEITEHLDNYMKNIFDNLDIGFKYSHLDKYDNVWFSNGKNEGYYYTEKKNNDIEDRNIFTIDELSTGEKTLLSKVLYLYFKDYKDKVILIDEPELSLHPSWQNKVLKIYENFAKKNNCQIIIATHSPHIIGSAKNEYLRILRKGEEGNVEVVDNLMAYGRDIEWVLEEVMGTQYTREKKILEKIEACDTLINEEKFDEADNAIDALEAIIGEHDSEILTLRNSLAFERMDFEEDN